MIRIEVQTAEVRRPISPGQTRVVLRASDEQGRPQAVFLCGVEPPNSFERRMRESFHTICSVEDMVEYPIGVSSVLEIDPRGVETGTMLYCAQENTVYVCQKNRGDEEHHWQPFVARNENLNPNVHSHKLPFFRRSAIDVILPHRDFVVRAIDWIEKAVRLLEKDLRDLERLKSYEP